VRNNRGLVVSLVVVAVLVGAMLAGLLSGTKPLLGLTGPGRAAAWSR